MSVKGEGMYKCGSYEELDQESSNSSSSLTGSSSEERLDFLQSAGGHRTSNIDDRVYPDGVQKVIVYGGNTRINVTPSYNMTVVGPAYTQILNPMMGGAPGYPQQGGVGYPPQGGAGYPQQYSQPVYPNQQNPALTHPHSHDPSMLQLSEQREMKEAPSDDLVNPLLQSPRVLNEEDIQVLSKCIGTGWRDLGIRLHFKPTQLDQFKADSTSHSNMCYKMLFRWMQWKDTQATITKLTKYLYLADEFDAIRHLAAHMGITAGSV